MAGIGKTKTQEQAAFSRGYNFIETRHSKRGFCASSNPRVCNASVEGSIVWEAALSARCVNIISHGHEQRIRVVAIVDNLEKFTTY